MIQHISTLSSNDSNDCKEKSLSKIRISVQLQYFSGDGLSEVENEISKVG